MPRRIDNPPNPWRSDHVEYLEGEGEDAALEVYEEQAKSIIARNDSPDISFRFSINPYRGCFHGCAYCYARPSHELLGYGAGTDFERRIVVKTNAAQLLREAFERPSWEGDFLAFSGVTDCYQPLEASYQITRQLLEVCLEYRNPVGVITKGALIERDVDLLAELARVAGCQVYLSIPFADDGLGRAIEPFASSIRRRFEVLAKLSAAGIPTGVSLAPMIPGLNDDQIPTILQRAREAGATSAFMVMLRLPKQVDVVFESRLREAVPLRAEKVLSGVRQSRDGELYNPRFGERMRGHGPRWQAIEQLFDAHRRRLGYRERDCYEESAKTFRRPRGQQSLF